jgi:hypothetical protein
MAFWGYFSSRRLSHEKTRGRCRNPIPCLRLGRYVQLGGRGGMADGSRAPGNPSGKAVSYEPPESGRSGSIKTGFLYNLTVLYDRLTQPLIGPCSTVLSYKVAFRWASRERRGSRSATPRAYALRSTVADQ